jgi:hypothetical protein
MKWLLTILAGALIFAATAGCGGASDEAAFNQSLYRGAWAGNWSSTTGGETGTLSFTVNPDGSFDGTMTRSAGISGGISGVIDLDGDMLATAGFGANGTYVITGRVALGNTQLHGSFTYDYLGASYPASFTLNSGTGGGGGGGEEGGGE